MTRLKGLRWYVKVFFEPRDLWVGVFLKPAFGWDIYICPLPCLVIHVYQGVKF
jgi:hypothetical protein